MKAQSTIRELHDIADLLFGDPEREYDYLRALERYREVPGGVEADAESYEERQATVRFTFATPEVLHVQYVLDQEPPETTPMLAGPLPGPAPVVVKREGEDLVIDSGVLVLRVSRDRYR
jgi:hypothetical protein